MTVRVSIQTEDFDVGAEIAALRAQDKRVGAVCSFIGTVRDRNEGSTVSSMELEHYPCLLYTSPSPRDRQKSRMPSSA